nr:MAG TPA: hypothetical protein [Caudoviricetes sp.]
MNWCASPWKDDPPVYFLCLFVPRCFIQCTERCSHWCSHFAIFGTFCGVNYLIKSMCYAK